MSRMSNIDYTIRNWFKEHIAYIVVTIVIIGLAIHTTIDSYTTEREKENRINNIEKTLQEHTHYIDELEADVDNLKEV